MSLLSIVLLSAAITVVYTLGSIFSPIRDRGPQLWRDWGSCPICCGTWIGAVVCAALGDVWALHPGRIAVLLLATGCASGALALIARRVVDTLAMAEAALESKVEEHNQRRTLQERSGLFPPRRKK